MPYFNYWEPNDERIFKPAGCMRLLNKLRKTWKSGIKRILIHGPPSTCKTITAKYFVNRELAFFTIYLSLPLDENEVKRCYFFIKSASSRYEGVGIIIDELEKIKNLETIGWLCHLLELETPKLFIGITNRPWQILKDISDVWKRFLEDGELIFAEPHTVGELCHIINAVCKKLEIGKEQLSNEARKKLARRLRGYTFRTILRLLNLAKKDRNACVYGTILRAVETRRVMPAHPKPVIENYFNELHMLENWETLGKHMLEN